MLHNNHIIKALSNAILSTFIIALISNTVSINSMGVIGDISILGSEYKSGSTSFVPTPPNPPFGK